MNVGDALIFDKPYPWTTVPWHKKVDYPAPDRSEIRLLADVPGGGLAHCTLQSATTSRAVYHQTVDEIWHFLSGSGEIWRKYGRLEQVQPVGAGTSVNILHGTSFQFRNTGTGPLCFVIATIPRWPGPAEAVQTIGPWQPTEPS